MFGYIKPLEPELKVKDAELYKAVYCGLCRGLSKEYGLAARFTLSYDFTFVAMLYSSLNEEEPRVSPCRCPFNPLKKRPHLELSQAVSFSSDAAMLLLWAKNMDNIEDSSLLGGLPWRAALPFTRGAAAKAAGKLPQAMEAVKLLSESQSAVERLPDVTLDMACNPTASTLGTLFSLMSEDGANKRVLSRLGYMMGRFCYICDAIDDLDKDREKGRFNPLLKNSETERLTGLLNTAIAEACGAYALLTPLYFKDILDNIIYMGLPSTAHRLINKSKNQG